MWVFIYMVRSQVAAKTFLVVCYCNSVIATVLEFFQAAWVLPYSSMNSKNAD